jgi:hypothetical protein
MLEDEEMLDKFAQLVAEGVPHSVLAQQFGVTPRTTKRWKARPEIKERIHKIIVERADRILRHTDTAVERWLEKHPEADIDTILKIRREFAGSTVNVKGEQGDKAKAMAEVMQAIHDDPDLAEKLGAAMKPADGD